MELGSELELEDKGGAGRGRSGKSVLLVSMLTGESTESGGGVNLLNIRWSSASTLDKVGYGWEGTEVVGVPSESSGQSMWRSIFEATRESQTSASKVPSEYTVEKWSS